jgi:hypothetical protein
VNEKINEASQLIITIRVDKVKMTRKISSEKPKISQSQNNAEAETGYNDSKSKKFGA